MSIITANQARELSGLSVRERAEEQADIAFELIREAATLRKRDISLHGDFWVKGGYTSDTAWVIACNIIRNQGFDVSFYYKEHQLNVDMYTVIKW